MKKPLWLKATLLAALLATSLTLYWTRDIAAPLVAILHLSLLGILVLAAAFISR